MAFMPFVKDKSVITKLSKMSINDKVKCRFNVILISFSFISLPGRLKYLYNRQTEEATPCTEEAAVWGLSKKNTSPRSKETSRFVFQASGKVSFVSSLLKMKMCFWNSSQMLLTKFKNMFLNKVWMIFYFFVLTIFTIVI